MLERSARTTMSIKTVGVVGAGTMGSGIAQTFAQAGFDVRLVDVAQPMLDRARRARGKQPGEVRREGPAVGGRSRRGAGPAVARARALDALAAADFVVEAIVEDVDAKKALFSALDGLTAPECVLASNTSSISITVLGAATKRPDRVLGMHFMNPVPHHGARRVDPRAGDIRRLDGDRARSLRQRSGRPRSRRATTPGSSPTASSCR